MLRLTLLLVLLVLLVLLFGAAWVQAASLTAARLGVIYNSSDRASSEIAHYYALRRGIPERNLVGLIVPNRAVISRQELSRLRDDMLDKLPSEVQSLLLVWSRPYAVECMSITTAFATGYQPGFCEPGCGRTTPNPLYATDGWLPADTAGWLPAMLLPSEEQSLAKAVIDRGVNSDDSRPTGIAFLVRTSDSARNVRASTYVGTRRTIAGRLEVQVLTAPILVAHKDAIAYFTGAVRVDELHKISFLPGAAADHLTSTGGVLDSTSQMSALEWLGQGATASYGTVSEPCNLLEKFPSPEVFLDRYLRGDSLLEAYWKSVAMPGQGLFIGEPLARPYGRSL